MDPRSRRAAEAALGPAGIQSDRIVTADEVKDIPLVLATVNTFVVLNILGVVALCLAVVLGVVYLQVRQRSRSLASTLSTRMGSDDAMSRRSLTLELGAPMLVALVVGTLVGMLVAPTILGALDPLPAIPPEQLSVQPWEAVAAATALLVVATFVGGWLAARAARRISLAEVMRVGLRRSQGRACPPEEEEAERRRSERRSPGSPRKPVGS